MLIYTKDIGILAAKDELQAENTYPRNSNELFCLTLNVVETYILHTHC